MIALAGGHGKIGLRLTRRVSSRGETVVGLIRNPEHADEVRAQGGEPVLCDLEHASVQEIAAAIAGASAVVFAAGAGPGSGAQRKLSMDRDGAIKLIDAAVQAGVPRYLMVSATGAENPHDGDDASSVYLRSKAEADEALRNSDREWTIVRPGGLTDEPGSGRVRLDPEPFSGEIPRDDVAALLDAVLQESRATHLLVYAGGGDVPIEQALSAVL